MKYFVLITLLINVIIILRRKYNFNVHRSYKQGTETVTTQPANLRNASEF